MKYSIVILAAIICIVNTLFAQTPDDYSFRQTYRVSTPAELEIQTNDGFIKVNPHSSNEIEVFFIVRKNNRVLEMDLEELEDHLDVDITSSSDRLEIKIRQKESNWIGNWKDRYYVSLQINAPARTGCNLKTSDGDITLMGFEGEQTCKTSDGDITVDDIQGNLSAQTSDGDIEVSDIQGEAELITSDGDIRVADITGTASLRTSDGKIIASNINGDTKAQTSDGNILLENIRGENEARTSDGNIEFENMRGSLTAHTSDGDIRGDLDQLTNKLYLKTSDGNITVSVPGGLGLDVRLKGEDIHTQLDDFSGNTGDHYIEGTIRGGGVEVELITSDGDINLNYQ